jgi:TetR/AcrR family transcriptional regulator
MVNPRTEATPPLDQDTESRILDAAHAVLMRQGTAGARMQEIAREAGVNKALLHYYFRSKDRLAEAVFQRAARRLLPPVIATLGSDAPLEEKVERVIALELENLERTPLLPGYILCEISHHPERVEQLVATVTGTPVERLMPGLIEKLGEQIDERVRAGTMRPIAPAQFVANLLALCLFPFAAQPMMKVIFGWDQSGFDAFIAERKERLAGFFLSALRP